jgi:hypothetical protein
LNPPLKALLPFFQHLPQSFPLVRRQNRVHSILRTIENSFYLTQIQRAGWRNSLSACSMIGLSFMILVRREM